MPSITFTLDQLKGAIFGLVTGDALGVPVEFQPREKLKKNPVKTMRAYGTNNQPSGTWSDDSSLTFCLMDALCEGYDLNQIAEKFLEWLYENLWTPHGRVFDIGVITNDALKSIKRNPELSPDLAGGKDENDNGNGSLMRILPLAFYIRDMSIEERYEKVRQVSSITHGHLRSVLCCFFYTEMVLQILQKKEKKEAFFETQK